MKNQCQNFVRASTTLKNLHQQNNSTLIGVVVQGLQSGSLVSNLPFYLCIEQCLHNRILYIIVCFINAIILTADMYTKWHPHAKGNGQWHELFWSYQQHHKEWLFVDLKQIYSTALLVTFASQHWWIRNEIQTLVETSLSPFSQMSWLHQWCCTVYCHRLPCDYRATRFGIKMDGIDARLSSKCSGGITFWRNRCRRKGEGTQQIYHGLPYRIATILK